jgi:hypothetical protein
MEELLKYCPKEQRSTILAHRALDQLRRIREEV